MGLFILFRYLFSIATVEDVNLLLRLVDKIISLCMNSESEFITGKGYYHPSLQIIIEKSCSGGNFFFLSFFMACFVLVNHRVIRWVWIIPCSLILSYLLTLLANTGRIIGYLVIRQNFIWIHRTEKEHFYHTGTGIVVYLTFLILFYMLLNKYVLNKRISIDEKAP